MSEEKKEAVDRLNEILLEMIDMTEEATRLIRVHGSNFDYERAKAYCLAQIKCALNKDHGYLGGSMCTLEEVIQSMDEDYEDED